MSELKSLADQLRNKIANKEGPVKPEPPKKKKSTETIPEILEQLRAYDLAVHDSMIHVRFENPTAALLHHLKRATGIEVNKVVGFAVRQFLEQHPELKTLVKNYLQQLEL
ncbi:MAG: hypothetical protein ACXVJV_12265 [Mucilaginibacter sp.]